MPANDAMHEEVRKVIKSHTPLGTVVFFAMVPVPWEVIRGRTPRELAAQVVPEVGMSITKQIIIAKNEAG